MAELIEKGLVVQPSPGAVPRRKLYLDEGKGVPVQSLWDDIAELNSQAQERLGYPTQKPLALLERIISASSNEGDLVLDPFCGCGTTIHAAEKLRRQWIGIDITPLAISLVERRLKDAFPGLKYHVEGIPKDLDGARALAAHDKHKFQLWAVNLVDGQPYREGKKGADTGIDGFVYIRPDGKRTETAIVSVKGGEHVSAPMIRELRGVLERTRSPMGLFVTLAPPTKPMISEAAAAGLFEAVGGRYPRIQILTIEELLAGKRPQLPFGHTESFRRARREASGTQAGLFDQPGKA